MRKTVLILGILASFNANAWEACGTDADGNTANCEYQIIDGTLTIRGVGNNGNIGYWLPGNKVYPSPWRFKSFTNIVIEDSIKDLGYEGFSFVGSNTPIVVPSSITTISADAFKYLYADEVILPDSITSIDHHAFCYATIKSINIPESVTSIGTSAFMGATSLKNVIIPDSVTSVKKSAFYGCTNLQSLTISDDVNLKAMFTINDEVSYPSNLKIYCTGDTAKCDANLEAAGYPELKSIGATKRKVNGMTYILDKKGNIVASSGRRTEKRIYTIDEANIVAGNVNSVKIKYR